MKIIRVLFFTAVVFFTAALLLGVIAEQAEGASINWKGKKVIPITGEVGGDILDQALQIQADIKVKGLDKVRLLINSPGG